MNENPLLTSTRIGLEGAYRTKESAMDKAMAFEYGKKLVTYQAEKETQKQGILKQLEFNTNAFINSKSLADKKFYGNKLKELTGWDINDENADDILATLKNAESQKNPKDTIQIINNIGNRFGIIPQEAKGMLGQAGISLVTKEERTPEEEAMGRAAMVEGGLEPSKILPSEITPSYYVLVNPKNPIETRRVASGSNEESQLISAGWQAYEAGVHGKKEGESEERQWATNARSALVALYGGKITSQGTFIFEMGTQKEGELAMQFLDDYKNMSPNTAAVYAKRKATNIYRQLPKTRPDGKPLQEGDEGTVGGQNFIYSSGSWQIK